MSAKDQRLLYEKVFGEHWNTEVVPSSPAALWAITGRDFETISVHPSIDASAAGHWHGFITGGEVK